ncbi:hypothetical protein M406DRAFT_330587 [Cryphonectria parasitica EP155]|uniref:Uncharacterized protein n=1 Tax=Cryphonectria parasitica (strain ATCC 38755 / EP155) TaxID=660469 RepID=A0A9P5CMC9_CRYP1|nr:uncharacterized protein M406DRAFT_330587 [Cryphonectria parasitica EP155]KAF3764239.1 hypothetical protein M406DRAFT_330587 [Cryphonectria parasitica EP155]
MSLRTTVVGFNPRRRDQQAQMWMGLFEAKHPLTEEQSEFLLKLKSAHASNPGSAPTSEELREGYLTPPVGHDHAKYKKICQAFTDQTVSHRLRLRDSKGNSTFNDSCGKEDVKMATISYPDQQYIIMAAPMQPGPRFPVRPLINSRLKMKGKGRMARRLNYRAKPTLMDMLGLNKLVAEQIFEYLPYTSRAALFQTCTEAAWIVGDYQVMYDFTQGNLFNSEYNDQELEQLQSKGEIGADAESRGALHLMVTRTHRDWHVNKNIAFRPKADYWRMGTSLCRLFRSFSLHTHNTYFLTLANLEHVDDRVAAGLVKLLPKLKKLEIVNCEMFRLHHVARFLDLIADLQKERGTYIHIDIAPLFERGCMWMNDNSQTWNVKGPETSRKGTFGVTWTDSGVKIPTAIVGLLFYRLLPAIYGAGQDHMIIDTASLLRQYLEALPLPAFCIPYTMAAYDLKLAMDAEIAVEGAPIIAEAARQMEAVQLQAEMAGFIQDDDDDEEEDDEPIMLPEFKREDWSQELLTRVTHNEIIISFTLAKAMYGEDLWLETFDRGYRSTSFQCSINNYGIWAEVHECAQCKKPTQRMFFSAGFICEACRLGLWVDLETDHMKYHKRKAVDALGFTWTEAHGYSGVAESNLPKEKDFVAIDAEGRTAPLIHTKLDFVKRVVDLPKGPMHEFCDVVDKMSHTETKLGPIGHVGYVQADHPDSGYQSVASTVRDSLRYMHYRESLTCEKLRDNNAYFTGWNLDKANKAMGATKTADGRLIFW